MMTVGQPKGYLNKIALVTGLVVGGIVGSNVFFTNKAIAANFGWSDNIEVPNASDGNPTSWSNFEFYLDIPSTTTPKVNGKSVNGGNANPPKSAWYINFPSNIQTGTSITVTWVGNSTDNIPSHNKIHYYFSPSPSSPPTYTSSIPVGTPEPLNILGATTGLVLFGTVSTALKRRKISK